MLLNNKGVAVNWDCSERHLKDDWDNDVRVRKCSRILIRSGLDKRNRKPFATKRKGDPSVQSSLCVRDSYSTPCVLSFYLLITMILPDHSATFG